MDKKETAELKKHSNWWIITLQCCAGFCHSPVWISHNYIYIPSLLSLPAPLPATPRPRSSQITRLCSLSSLAASPGSSVLRMREYMFQCHCFSSSCLLLPSPCPKVCSLCLHLYFCPASTFSSTTFLDSIYTHYYTIFAFSGSRLIDLIGTDSNLFLFMAEQHSTAHVYISIIRSLLMDTYVTFTSWLL